MVAELLIIAALIPLASSVITLFFGSKMGEPKAGWFATAAMAGSFVVCLMALMQYDGTPATKPIPWVPLPGNEAGWLYLGIFADSLTVTLMAMVSLISTLVHLYSIGYMHGDKRFSRFFCYLSLFTFSMMGIVTANGLMQLFVFWELVGLTSYLLIGFWFEKRGPQLACKKAFVMNRIGDMGFLIGFGILFQKLGAQVMLPATDGGMFDHIQTMLDSQGVSITENPPLWLTAAGIGLFFGAIGKSAQFPLHTWLPDAMEGPTPVSSIVHSATMVAAGVYLAARIAPILTPAAHLFVATIGLITLIMAALMAIVMTDIKRVLAYSTLSQLGYMILGVGCGAYTFALFHLITHAFFKCCLFQCSGSVILAAHHEQDMTQYGGLGKRMPKTMIAYGLSTLCIAGASIPLTHFGLAGFYSKDGILGGAYNYSHVIDVSWSWIFFWGPIIIAYVTPFYMARSFALTFMGEPRSEHAEHAHEAPWTMFVPQFILVGMALLAGWFMAEPMIEQSRQLLAEKGATALQSGADIEHGLHGVHGPLLWGGAWILTIAAGMWMYKDGFGKANKVMKIVPALPMLHKWALNKFYFDALYDTLVVNIAKAVANIAAWIDKYLVDGVVNGAGYLGKAFGWAAGLFDTKFVDGLVNGAAEFAQSSGRLLRHTHNGQLRGYVLTLFVSVVVVTIIVVTVAMQQ